MMQVLPAPYHFQRWPASAQEVFFSQLCQYCVPGHIGDLCGPHLHCCRPAALQESLWLPQNAGQHDFCMK